MTDPAPNRTLGALLAFTLPPGIGHAYLGLARRGAIWLALSVAAQLGVPALGPTLGLGTRGTLALLFACFLFPWIAPVVDVLLLPRARIRPANKNALIALACVGIGAAIVVRIATRIVVLEAFKIPSGAMIPTLLIGDHVFVDKLVYRTRAPRYGEVMVFAFPEHPQQDFIKRVVLLPGDRLDVKDGHPSINGWEVPHCKIGTYSYAEEGMGTRHTGELDVEFLGDQAYLTFYDAAAGGFTEQQGPYRAKSGEYWVMGDNRNNSHDSRMWFGGMGGGVPRDLIRGHALVLWLSVGDGGTDWSRTGQAVEGPTLPKGSEALQPALDACMKTRPSISASTPPPARS